MRALSRNHDITSVALITPELDPAEAQRAAGEYCREVVLVPSRRWEGLAKRLLQARSLLSTRSHERRFYCLPALQRALDSLLSRRRYDIVNVEAPHLANLDLAQAPAGQALPRLTLDEHNLEFDLLRQMAETEPGFARRLYNSLNWPKVRREELSTWRRFDGITFTSAADQARARDLVPSLRSAVIPNSVDVEFFRPRATDPTAARRCSSAPSTTAPTSTGSCSSRARSGRSWPAATRGRASRSWGSTPRPRSSPCRVRESKSPEWSTICARTWRRRR
jgi:glycosyltransferase involved in cell wall biosynthesis